MYLPGGGPIGGDTPKPKKKKKKSSSSGSSDRYSPGNMYGGSKPVYSAGGSSGTRTSGSTSNSSNTVSKNRTSGYESPSYSSGYSSSSPDAGKPSYTSETKPFTPVVPSGRRRIETTKPMWTTDGLFGHGKKGREMRQTISDLIDNADSDAALFYTLEDITANRYDVIETRMRNRFDRIQSDVREQVDENIQAGKQGDWQGVNENPIDFSLPRLFAKGEGPQALLNRINQDFKTLDAAGEQATSRTLGAQLEHQFDLKAARRYTKNQMNKSQNYYETQVQKMIGQEENDSAYWQYNDDKNEPGDKQGSFQEQFGDIDNLFDDSGAPRSQSRKVDLQTGNVAAPPAQDRAGFDDLLAGAPRAKPRKNVSAQVDRNLKAAERGDWDYVRNNPVDFSAGRGAGKTLDNIAEDFKNQGAYDEQGTSFTKGQKLDSQYKIQQSERYYKQRLKQMYNKAAPEGQQEVSDEQLSELTDSISSLFSDDEEKTEGNTQAGVAGKAILEGKRGKDAIGSYRETTSDYKPESGDYAGMTRDQAYHKWSDEYDKSHSTGGASGSILGTAGPVGKSKQDAWLKSDAYKQYQAPSEQIDKQESVSRKKLIAARQERLKEADTEWSEQVAPNLKKITQDQWDELQEKVQNGEQIPANFKEYLPPSVRYNVKQTRRDRRAAEAAYKLFVDDIDRDAVESGVNGKSLTDKEREQLRKTASKMSPEAQAELIDSGFLYQQASSADTLADQGGTGAWILDKLSRPVYGVNAARKSWNEADDNPEDSADLGKSLLMGAANPAVGLGYLLGGKNPTDSIDDVSWGMLGGAALDGWDAASSDIKGFSDNPVTNAEVIEEGLKNNPNAPDWMNTDAYKGIAGFVGDVAFDPLSYVGVGLVSGVSRGALRAVGKEGIKAGSRKAAKTGLDRTSVLADDLADSTEFTPDEVFSMLSGGMSRSRNKKRTNYTNLPKSKVQAKRYTQNAISGHSKLIDSVAAKVRQAGSTAEEADRLVKQAQSLVQSRRALEANISDEFDMEVLTKTIEDGVKAGRIPEKAIETYRAAVSNAQLSRYISGARGYAREQSRFAANKGFGKRRYPDKPDSFEGDYLALSKARDEARQANVDLTNKLEDDLAAGRISEDEFDQAVLDANADPNLTLADEEATYFKEYNEAKRAKGDYQEVNPFSRAFTEDQKRAMNLTDDELNQVFHRSEAAARKDKRVNQASQRRQFLTDKKLGRMEQDLAHLKRTVGPNDPKVFNKQSQINQLKKRIKVTGQEEYAWRGSHALSELKQFSQEKRGVISQGTRRAALDDMGSQVQRLMDDAGIESDVRAEAFGTDYDDIPQTLDEVIGSPVGPLTKLPESWTSDLVRDPDTGEALFGSMQEQLGHLNKLIKRAVKQDARTPELISESLFKTKNFPGELEGFLFDDIQQMFKRNKYDQIYEFSPETLFGKGGNIPESVKTWGDKVAYTLENLQSRRYSQLQDNAKRKLSRNKGRSSISDDIDTVFDPSDTEDLDRMFFRGEKSKTHAWTTPKVKIGDQDFLKGSVKWENKYNNDSALRRNADGDATDLAFKVTTELNRIAKQARLNKKPGDPTDLQRQNKRLKDLRYKQRFIEDALSALKEGDMADVKLILPGQKQSRRYSQFALNDLLEKNKAALKQIEGMEYGDRAHTAGVKARKNWGETGRANNHVYTPDEISSPFAEQIDELVGYYNEVSANKQLISTKKGDAERAADFANQLDGIKSSLPVELAPHQFGFLRKFEDENHMTLQNAVGLRNEGNDYVVGSVGAVGKPKKPVPSSEVQLPKGLTYELGDEAEQWAWDKMEKAFRDQSEEFGDEIGYQQVEFQNVLQTTYRESKASIAQQEAELKRAREQLSANANIRGMNDQIRMRMQNIDRELGQLHKTRDALDDAMKQAKKDSEARKAVLQQRIEEDLVLQTIDLVAKQYGNQLGVTLIGGGAVPIPGSQYALSALKATSDLPLVRQVVTTYNNLFAPPFKNHPYEVSSAIARRSGTSANVIESKLLAIRNTIGQYDEATRKEGFWLWENGTDVDIAGRPEIGAIRELAEGAANYLRGNYILKDKALHWSEINRFLPDEMRLHPGAVRKALKKDLMDGDLARNLVKLFKDPKPDKKGRVKDPKVDPVEFFWKFSIAAETAAADKAMWQTINETFGVKRTVNSKGEPLPEHPLSQATEKLGDLGWVPVKSKYSNESYYMPPELANDVAKLKKMFDPQQDLVPFGKNIDAAIRAWKQIATIPNPGFWIRNAVGEVTTSYLAGVNNPIYYKKARDIVKFWRGDGKELQGLKQQLPQYGYTPSDIPSGQSVVVKRPGGNTLTREQALLSYHDNGLHTGIIRTDFGQTESIPGKIAQKLDQTTAGRNTRKARDWAQQKSAGFEDFFRMAHFLHAIEHAPKHMKMYEATQYAAAEVRKAHFDYRDVTQFERVAMTRVFPFYKYTRKMLPLMMEMAFAKPGKFTTYPKAMHNATVALGTNDILGDDNGYMPNYEGIVPEWLTDQWAYRVFDDRENATSVFAGMQVPPIDALRTIQGPGDSAYQLLNPLLKFIPEQVAGEQLAGPFQKSDVRSKEERSVHALRTLGGPVGGWIAKGMPGYESDDRQLFGGVNDSARYDPVDLARIVSGGQAGVNSPGARYMESKPRTWGDDN